MRPWPSRHVGPLFKCIVWTSLDSLDLGLTAKGTLALWDGRCCVSDDGYLHCPWRLWPSEILWNPAKSAVSLAHQKIAIEFFRRIFQGEIPNIQRPISQNLPHGRLRLYWDSKSWASNEAMRLREMRMKNHWTDGRAASVRFSNRQLQVWTHQETIRNHYNIYLYITI